MKTITINERTKAGKTLLELANLLAISNKGVFIETGLGKPTIKTKPTAVETSLKEIKNGKVNQYKSVDDFFKKVVA